MAAAIAEEVEAKATEPQDSREGLGFGSCCRGPALNPDPAVLRWGRAGMACKLYPTKASIVPVPASLSQIVTFG